MQVVGTMNMGGAETFLMNIYRNINKNDYKFYFLCFTEEKFYYEDEIKSLGGIIIRIAPIRLTRIKEHINQIKFIIKKYNIDIVHAHTYYNSIFSLIAAKKCGIKNRIVHAHTTKGFIKLNIIQKLYSYISKILINHYATIKLACSKEAGDSLYLDRKYTIIKNGIDEEKFKFNLNKRNELRDKMNIEQNTIVIGNVARFLKEKNHEFLIEVFNRYHMINSNSKLLLIGDGPLRKEIEMKVKAYGINDDVIFLGIVNNVYELYNAMDIFAFPSLYEGLGIALIEAQTNGLKCLASENVPRETRITSEIEYIDIQKIEDWTKKILESKVDRIHKIDEEYDIKSTIINLQKIYKGEYYEIN